jgi:1-acyl-sn-glycerol-3-phosphate acyltransferase
VSTTDTWAGTAPGAGSRIRPSTILMNLWAYPMMVLWTLFGMFVMFPVLMFVGFVIRQDTDRRVRLLIWLYGRGWIALMRPFVKFRWQAAADDLFAQPGMIVVNHLSFFDTYFMGRIPNYNMAFAVRSWPFKMPWYGAFMRLAGYLDVEAMSFEESFAAARRVFEKGGLVVFFPEGHRSRNGRMHRFHSGAFKIAHAAGVPVIPVVIRGTDVLLGPGRLLLQPAEVTLTALPAFKPESFPGPEGYFDLRQAVKAAMERELHA